MTRARGFGIVLLLTLCLTAAWQSGLYLPFADAQQAPGQAALPADLDLVPRDALGFITGWGSKSWDSQAVRQVRQQLGKEADEAMQHFEKNTGLTLTEVERATGVITEVSPNKVEILVIVATSKPYDRTKVRAAIGPKTEEKAEQGKNYALDTNQDLMLYFASDRILVIGTVRAGMSLLKRPGEQAQGPLSAALSLAAQPHAAVGGINPQPLVKQFGQMLPPQAAAFKPLLEIKTGTLVVDTDKEIKVNLRFDFPQAQTAQEGEQALQGLLFLARAGMGFVMPEITKDPNTPKQFVELAKHLEEGLKHVTVQRKDTVVETSLVVKADLTAMTATLGDAIGKVRESASRTRSQNNLKQIALAMHNYHDVYQSFPTPAIYSKDGKPLLSWRVMILPFLEQENLYKQFKLNEPWDSPNNKPLLAKMPPIYAPLSDNTPKEPFATHYQVFTGKGTVFEGPKGIGLKDILDGTSNTLMAAEAATAVPWTKPDDLAYDDKQPLPKLGGLFPGGFNAALCDGSVRFLSKDLDPNLLRALITRAGGEVVNLP